METSLKFIVVPLGSAGDVHPLVWLGKLLQGRGHEVVMAAQSVVADIPERAGLRTVACGKKEDQEAILKNPDIWHPNKAFELLLGYMPAWVREMLPVVKQEIRSGEARGKRVVLVAGTLAFGAVIAAEQTGVPVLSVHLQPSMFISAEETPVLMAGLEWVPKMPRWVRRMVVAMGTWRVDQAMRPRVNEVRKEAGLPAGPQKGLMDHCWHSKDGELALFPEWYARKASDWPTGAVNTRFPLYDEGTDRPVDESLEAFLAAGEAGGAGDAPVTITPGSANAHAAEFIREAVKACALLKRRALVITRFPQQAGEMPAGSACFAYAPFGRVFPRSAAVVHHGGVGTTAQCFAAGVPQLIMPMAHDQPDNAARVKQFGVGDFLYPKKFRAKAIAAKLTELSRSQAVKHACGELREKIRRQMSAAEVAELIESMAQQALRSRQNVGVGLATQDVSS